MSLQNKDTPAMPIELSGFGQYQPDAYTGLTKREMFAMHAMHGSISSDHHGAVPADVTARFAVAQADALLKELEK